MHPETRAARDAAVAVVSDLGLRYDEAVLIRDVSNVLIHFRPTSVVARIAGNTSAFRKGGAWLDREVRIAGTLHRAGAPVVPPSDVLPPGPHHHNGHIMTFRPFVEILDKRPDPVEIGATLRRCHELMATLDFGFPVMGCWHEAVRIFAALREEGALEPEHDRVLSRLIETLAAPVAALDVPMQIVHGDAGYGNVLFTERGLFWNDWEDTHRAPVAWDLAGLSNAAVTLGEQPERAERVLAGYGTLPDRSLIDFFVRLRAVQTCVWMAHLARFHPSIRPRLEARLAWLEHQ